MNSGIYRIRNQMNGKVYIGSAKNLKARWAKHRHDLREGKHINRYLQNAWNKYGEDSFVFEVVESVTVEQLLEREQFHLDKLFEAGNHYNVESTAGSAIGVKRSKETLAKMRSANLGKKWGPRSPETRAKIAEANRRREYNPETYAKIAAKKKGQKHTPETIEKIRATSTGRKYPNKKPQTDEHKAKNSAALKGRQFTEEHKAALSAALKGRTFSEEARAAMRAAWVRRKAKE